jgi:cysteine desulfurase
VTLLAPDARGLIDPVALERALQPGAALVSLIAGHNELGTVQPLDAIAAVLRSSGARLHLDAVQLAGVADLSDLPWDLLSLSAHKLGGPQGVGALVVRGGVPLAPVLVGGPQELGLRPGTVPVALAAAFGAAAEAVRQGRAAEARRLAGLRNRLAGAILARVPGLVRLGAWEAPGGALPHLVTLGFDGARGDELVAALDQAGIAASSSAACLGDSRSHVLEAIGLPERVGVVRLSLGWSTTEAEIEAAAPRIASALASLAQASPFERRRPLFASRAAAAGVDLTTAHWEAAEAVFAFHAANGILPGPRHLQRTLGDAVPLERLFPRGMASLAEWLGLPLPQGGCRPAPV